MTLWVLAPFCAIRVSRKDAKIRKDAKMAKQRRKASKQE